MPLFNYKISEKINKISKNYLNNSRSIFLKKSFYLLSIIIIFEWKNYLNNSNKNKNKTYLKHFQFFFYIEGVILPSLNLVYWICFKY